ncbi:hypothetical protein N3K66_008275 [Trichothecium roseum]|uniref:Uncharacterized protein n=1 Tax=Trichothecium roseum TaxID=47278 RepID=A0ACC0UT41_9HYPO|nr:hypothetical protein N3K66_008275 [Trichothecium roseum]
MSGDGAPYVPKSPDLSSFNAPGPTPAPPNNNNNSNITILSLARSFPIQDRITQLPKGNLRRKAHIISIIISINIINNSNNNNNTIITLPPACKEHPRGPCTTLPVTGRTRQQSQSGFGVGNLHGAAWAPSHSYDRQKPPGHGHDPLRNSELNPEAKTAHGSDLAENNTMPPRRAAARAAAAANSAAALESSLSSSPPPEPEPEPELELEQQQQQQQQLGLGPEPVPFEPSPVKTKFPTARIKRIMQADEEVGKVAQQTPIAVGKALELFMVQLVSKSAEIAREKGTKKVSAHMLKQVVEADDQWDFLREIVSRVEVDKEGGGGKAKAKADSDTEDDEPKKKGRGGRKKKSIDS